MDTWRLEREGFDPAAAVPDGDRFLCANGYMGLRGVWEEADVSHFPAITLAGVYDRAGDKWREPVNAPRCLFAELYFNGQPLALGKTEPVSHSSVIDYRHGEFLRDTLFGPAGIRSRRFPSMADCHLLADRFCVYFREEGEMTLRIGISTELWDINGPHLGIDAAEQGETLLIRARTGEKGIVVSAAQCVRTDAVAEERTEEDGHGVFRVLRRRVRAGEEMTVSIFGAVYTSLDTEDPDGEARACCEKAAGEGFEACLRAHREAWERIWERSEVRIECGDAEAERAMHASQYHLNCIAPRHARDMSIPARGLSGQTYKGAVFWDAEMFYFPMFVHTQPEIARSLLRYRIATLPGARRKAAEYGFRGAFYAWESQEGGAEGCTDFNVVDVFTHRPVRTYFRDKQIHISADIAYAFRSYYDITGDRSLLEEGGAEVILECARFYLSRASCHADRETVDFADVIGPDEYHERVTNNAFTNRMIRYCMESALGLREIFRDRGEWYPELIRSLDYEKDMALIEGLLPRIRGFKKRDGVIEQFDGYFDLEDASLGTVRSRLKDPREYWGGDHGVAGPTQIIKQADVIAMAALLPECLTDREAEACYDYYEPRTEHGSSLSACMYALTACRIGHPGEAWRLFMKTAAVDVLGGGKKWAGEIYIGGTHPAANGGAWMIAALGFAGLGVHRGKVTLHPRLPENVSRLSFPVTAGGERLMIEVTRDGSSIRPIT